MLRIEFKTNTEAFGRDTDGDGPVWDVDATIREIARQLSSIMHAIAEDCDGQCMEGVLFDANGKFIGDWGLNHND